MGFLGGSYLREMHKGMTELFRELTLQDILSMNAKSVSVHVSNYCCVGGNLSKDKLRLLKEMALAYNIPWKIDNKSETDLNATITKEDKKSLIEKVKNMLTEEHEKKLQFYKNKLNSKLKELDGLIE